MVSVVIIDFNSAARTVKYIKDFIAPSDVKDLSFIVVDNSANKNNADSFRSEMKDADFSYSNNVFIHESGIETVFHVNEKNEGFAKANNIGAKIARERYHPDFLLFSNSDILFDERFRLSKLIEVMNADESIGLLGPEVIGLDGKRQSPAKYLDIYRKHIIPELLWPLHKFIPGLSRMNFDTVFNAVSGEVYRVIGAFMLMKADVFFDIGCFDENTFLYAEEVILSERLSRAGKKVYFYDGVTIVHEGGVTTKGNDIGEKKSYIAKRNRIFESEMYFYSQYKNVNGIVIGLAKLCFSFYLLKLKIAFALRRLL